ncbi:MAG: hypothetical protein JJE17_11650 [Peptostreptococcaceae bacterium]|nr:hypothetical protein [Peptostreptococcaceae bacterium]
MQTKENKEVFDSIKTSAKANVLLIGNLTSSNSANETRGKINDWKQIDAILKQVESGEILVLKFNKYWAQVLTVKGILSTPVTEWGGNQTLHWLGNGWGYLDHFVGDLSTANKGTISTNSREVPNDPYGFYPFENDSMISVYGMYLSRPWLCKEPAIGFRMLELQPTMTVTLGVIDYGKGKIILNPCYWVDENNAFTDMLFYNIIKKATNGDW